tara:strand:- start:2458 stop:2700 length:243 start_codon:yes stop_codon:yes gene_type:complete
MNGTVTISIEDYKKLENAQGNATTMNERTLQAAKEVEVFLSFLCTRESITPYIEEFNKQSRRSKIILNDGRIKIKFDEES